MKKFYTLLLLLFGLVAKAQDLVNTYDIKVNGINVGELIATKHIEGDKTIYKLNSKSVISVLGKTAITTSFVGVFKNEILQSSTYCSEKDAKIYDSSTITQNNGIYTISRKGRKSTLNKPIKYVTCLLYFEKPIKNEQYFDVLEAVFSPIKLIEPNTYLYIDSSNNEKTTYTFSNSILEQGTTKHLLYNYTFTLRKQTQH
ncbi:hypothetical protein O8E88_000809 [Flavobacterium psychrophilum]|uniref:DUF6134 family protein n=1 Tax=Flavobacterium psychrophilum TaxID=96345 RepID=UPI00073F7B36|nr:DUF6134 family protein [Flavobacterium psychrophilum]EKT2069020.1 hypothetical protein [Flavobacterium psychrophilum]MCB6001074.1 hypothetical protein [Flavobacterium psychrophilum]MCB6008986.1 hypothetical protein [Flavobacterium psychrophilum]QRE07219.1 hypothetical protein H0H27_03230 [Flavobacterium psychrophilum]QZL00809.1 hypothetical protein K5L04_01550 [Flavobacterium psychrophilum]